MAAQKGNLQKNNLHPLYLANIFIRFMTYALMTVSSFFDYISSKRNPYILILYFNGLVQTRNKQT